MVDAVLDESEQLLWDACLALAARLGPKSVAELDHYDDNFGWRTLADAGYLNLRAIDSTDGLRGSLFDVGLIVEAFGRFVVPVPFMGSVAIAMELLRAADAPSETLDPLGAGHRRLAVGLDPQLRDIAALDENGPILAIDSAGAVAALVLESRRLPRLVSIALGEESGGFDVTRQVRPCLPEQTVDIGGLGKVIDGDALLRWTACALSVVCADIVGGMAGALEMAVSYASIREQFGVPIGSFQAIQHLCAEQYVNLEGSRALAHYACWAADRLDVKEALLAARTAKAYCSEHGRIVCEAAIQVHGGMGITWDCMSHLFLKRVLLDRVLFGDEQVQLPLMGRLRLGLK